MLSWGGKLWMIGVIGLLVFSTQPVHRASAELAEPPGPDRADLVMVDYTSYNWWLVNWENNSVPCELYIDHEGVPTYDEVYKSCGDELYNSWVATKSCDPASTCEGYYLYYVASAPASKTVGVSLPPVQVWLSIKGCELSSYTNICKLTPVLVLTAEEPLPNEIILKIEGTLDGEQFSCGAVCELPLEQESPEGGSLLEFWAYSSYGDSSEKFQAKVRVVNLTDPMSGESFNYVDVLSDQWTSSPTASCSQTWESFPPIQGIPDWLSTPADASGMASNRPFELLARNLINLGIVDVSNCSDYGLLPSGQASPCGLKAAQPNVEKWQNRFDEQIFTIAQETGIPAKLLKNLFSRESQFWPGIMDDGKESGLGQLTANGADTALLWNPSFYSQYCPLVLDASVCRKPYALLDPVFQEMLQSALVRSVNSYCEDCPLGLNLEQANSSVYTFAQTLLANCEQAGQIVGNVFSENPGNVSSYEDLWRFSLVNYNAGSGCLILALETTDDLNEPVDWFHVSSHLTPVCRGALDYVRDISQ